MADSWQSRDEFIKNTIEVSGLPEKKINVDNDKQPTVSEQTCGQLYGNAINEAVAKEPILTCPNCSNPVLMINNAHQPYMLDKKSNGKAYKSALPKCPISGPETIPTILYSVYPCGCKVSTEWAGLFANELQSRLKGNKPLTIPVMTDAKRSAKLITLEGWLTTLYLKQKMAGDNETKRDIDYWIVVVVDQIQRLCPGIDIRKSPRALHGEVYEWANTNNLSKPLYEKGFALSDLDWQILLSMDINPKLSQEPFVEGIGYGSDFKIPPGYKKANDSQQDIIDKMLLNQMIKQKELEVKPIIIKKPKSPVAFDKVAEINFFGAKEEEKVLYINALKSIIKATTPTEVKKIVWPKNLLIAVSTYFYTDKEFITSLVQQAVLVEPYDTITLIQTAAGIEKNIGRYLTGEDKELTLTTIQFLQTFVNFVKVDEDKNFKPVQPIPLPPKIEPQRVNRHHKKKRTIRPMDDEEF